MSVDRSLAWPGGDPVNLRGNLLTRIYRMDAVDVVMFVIYISLIVWGTWAQIDPPLSLLGASGAALTRVVTICILAFAVCSAVGLLADQAAHVDKRWHAEWEISPLVGLMGSWGTYAFTVWLLVAGKGDPHLPPTLAVGGVLTTAILGPFLVRFVFLIRDSLKTLRDARKAIQWGLVDGDRS